MRIDHLVLNVDERYQTRLEAAKIQLAGLPYEPKKGKGTKGFQASNLWIGREYFELVRIKRPDGGGYWRPWVERYHQGQRGLICLMLATDDLDAAYEETLALGVPLSRPESLSFTLGFGPFKKRLTMPWRNSYLNFFRGVPLQLGLQQVKDQKTLANLQARMLPNAREQGIAGINRVELEGSFTLDDLGLLRKLFREHQPTPEGLLVHLEQGQELLFRQAQDYRVIVYTACENEQYLGRKLQIENVEIRIGGGSR